MLVTAGAVLRLPSGSDAQVSDRTSVAPELAAGAANPGEAAWPELDLSPAVEAAVPVPAEVAGVATAPVAAAPAVRAASQEEGGSFEIAGFPPTGVAVCARPEIVVRLRLLAPILSNGVLDPSMVEFVVDGMDVTGMAPIQGVLDFPQGQAFIVYVPETPLSLGAHDAMISVWAPDGTVQSHAWTFEAADIPCAGPPPPPPGAPIGAAPEGPPPPPQVSLPGVLHFQANDVQTARAGPQGPQEQSGQIEFWFDDQTGNTRTVYKDASGAPQTATVRNGQTTAQLSYTEKRAQITIFPENAPSPDAVLALEPLTLRAAVDRGDLPAAGEEVVNGRAALKVQVPGPPPAEGRDVYLDMENGLLLRQVVFGRGQSGDLEEVASRQMAYSVVEYINRGQVSGDVFSTSVPSDWQQVTSRILTPDAARAFRGFDIYWLGQDYRGMALANMSQDEGSSPQGSFSGVSVAYAGAQPPPDPQQAPSQILIQQYLPSAQEQQARQQSQQGQLPPGAERVTVAGRSGILMTQQGAPARLDLTIGRTAVVIIATDRAEAMRAGQDLQKLN